MMSLPAACASTAAMTNTHPRIKSDPKVIFGKPTIRRARITFEHILRCFAAGETVDDIVANYPH